MKKMGILASLALCVTIGGVYAAWQFAETDVSSAYANVAVSLASKADATTKGSLEIKSVNTGLKIDDPVDDNKKHTTVLTYTEGGKFVITFVANANAPDDVLKNGIDLQWKVGLATSANVAVPNVSDVKFKYDIDGDGQIKEGGENQVDEIQEIFTNIDSTLIDVGSYKTRDVNEDTGVVTFTYEVDMWTVWNKIDLAEIVLDKEAMYNEYSRVLGEYTLHFHVSEKA